LETEKARGVEGDRSENSAERRSKSLSIDWSLVPKKRGRGKGNAIGQWYSIELLEPKRTLLFKWGKQI